MRRTTLLGFALALAAAPGCAALARKPPTPAADIPIETARAATAPPGEHYYLLVFGSQSDPKRARYTHTWATVVRTVRAEAAGLPAVAEQHTISWMPATLDIRPLALRPEPGVNLGLHETVAEVLRHAERVAVWGPYEVTPGFYHRFQVQKQFLESGQVGYQCADTVGEAARRGNGCCCIHAITDLDPMFDRVRYPLVKFGQAGSWNVVRELHARPFLVGPDRDHGWLLPELGLDRYPLARRYYVGPTVAFTPTSLTAYLRRSGTR